MTDQLWNIAGVAAEIGVTPQAASAFHRGPEATPAADFKVVNTGLELWNVDSIEAWHEWLEARNKVAAEAKAAKAAPKQSAPKVPETPDETDTSHLTDEQIGDLGQPGDLETPDGLQEFAEVAESDEPNAFEQATSRKGRKTQQAGAA